MIESADFDVSFDNGTDFRLGFRGEPNFDSGFYEDSIGSLYFDSDEFLSVFQDYDTFDGDFSEAEVVQIGDHRLLEYRDAGDQHPISSITGLTSELETRDNVQADWDETDESSDSFIENKPSIPSIALSGLLKGDGEGNAVSAIPDTDYIATMPNRALSPSDGGNASKSNAILYGTVDSTSTSTAFTATVEGLTSLTDGTAIMLHNGVVTSASGFTIDINGLGEKPCFDNMTNATRDTTIFNINYTMLFIYASDLDSGNGGWWCYRGYNSDTNTIGYQLRTNNSSLPAADKFVRYRILFTSADGSKWVPATTSTSTNATAKRDVNQRKINPFAPIVYYGTTAAVAVDASPASANLWEQYALVLGYSFNRTGAALVLNYPAPLYIKCAPQSDGSAIIDDTMPYVQSLPSNNDGKIYIFLGIAYDATHVEMRMNHPVYFHDGNGVRLWVGSVS